MTKLCPKCKKEYPNTLKFFHRNYMKKDGLSSTCKTCANERAKKWREENPERYKDLLLKRNFGIALTEYNQMLDKQNHRCLICQKFEYEFKKKLYVDHNHETLKIRGLLCSFCNTSLAWYEKNKEKIIEYLV